VTAHDVARFEAAIAAGGVGLFPADTVYGLAVDPESQRAVRRLYELKGRPPQRPSAVMFFQLDTAVAALRALPPRTADALRRLLPGRITTLVPNPEHRFPLACGPDPGRLGVRVPALTAAIAPLAAIRRPLMQSSANLSGGQDARRLKDVDPAIRAGVDADLDGGDLPGVPSTVIDLTSYGDRGEYEIVREGAVATSEVVAILERE